ncbi:hypothetical protein [Microbacterium sp. K2]|uniref:hypothetical protein n=1 Tax=Microbacterium sp. K2 TaxID=3391827 RepID=UPI003EDA187F
MADANKTLVTRADFTSNVNAAAGRAQLLFDGQASDAASFTGVRDITGLITPGRIASGRLLMMREGSDVDWIFDKIVLPPEAAGLSWQLFSRTDLAPFRPFYTTTHDYRINTGGNIVRLSVNDSVAVFVQFAVAGLPISTVLQSKTRAGWPAALPGVADGQPVVIVP